MLCRVCASRGAAVAEYGSQGGGGLQGLQGFGDDVDGSGRGAWQDLAATYSLPAAGGGGGGDDDSSDGDEVMGGLQHCAGLQRRFLFVHRP